MIHDSTPWKNELLRIAERLQRRYRQKRWSEQSLFLLEKEVFVGAFSVRKLLDSNKVSDAVAGRRIKISAYPAGPKQVSLLSRRKFAELYDLYAAKKETVSYRDICNQLIHSFILAPFVPDGRALVGFYLASDIARKTRLYYVTSASLIELFSSVGTDEIREYRVRFDENKGTYNVELVAGVA